MDATTWDTRYSGIELEWGADANIWVQQHLCDLRPGKAWDIAAGEGRNAFWLAERGWHVDATDFSKVAVERIFEIAAERFPTGSHVAAWVADATAPAPQQNYYDLALLSYLQLPEPHWRQALTQAVFATQPGGHIFIVQHAARNLTEGVGGPQNPDLLFDSDDLVRHATDLPVCVEFAAECYRNVADNPRKAIDAVVRFRRL